MEFAHTRTLRGTLTHEEARLLLKPETRNVFKPEDEIHPWSRRYSTSLRSHLFFSGTVVDQLHDTPLMRSYDSNSGSQPDHQACMLARDCRMPLNTQKVRVDTLTAHADHANRKATPYVSFTNSPASLQEQATQRSNKRGDQYIVVIDPGTRFDLGLPVLHFRDEMSHYNVQPPPKYGGRDYWTQHYLCLWEVTPQEVVGVWRWDTLRDFPDWYQRIILPAAKQYRVSNHNIQSRHGLPDKPQIRRFPFVEDEEECWENKEG